LGPELDGALALISAGKTDAATFTTIKNDIKAKVTSLGGVIGRPSRLGRLSRGRYHPTVPVATAAATSEPNTRLRFVVAAFTILSLHGSVPKGFPDSTSVFSVGVDPVIRDGTSYHPDVPGTPTPHRVYSARRQPEKWVDARVAWGSR
jgi:hypothetical protein